MNYREINKNFRRKYRKERRYKWLINNCWIICSIAVVFASFCSLLMLPQKNAVPKLSSNYFESLENAMLDLFIEQVKAEQEWHEGLYKARAEERARARAEGIAEEELQKEKEAEAAKLEAQKQARASENKTLSSEWYLLAQIIFCEAGKNYEDKIYVGSIVLNRAKSNYETFKNVHTVREVLYQKGQYDSHTKNLIANGVVPDSDSIEVAKGLLNGTITGLDEHVLTWQSWMNGKIKPVELPNSCQFYGKFCTYQ